MPYQAAFEKGHADCARLMEIDADADANNTVRCQPFFSRAQKLTRSCAPRFFPRVVATTKLPDDLRGSAVA
jgi:hypothetical protein